MHIAKCCKCKRLFTMLEDTLYTEAVCGACVSNSSPVNDKADDWSGVLGIIEQGCGDIDGGQFASRIHDWYMDDCYEQEEF